jgi:hypothetical protein
MLIDIDQVSFTEICVCVSRHSLLLSPLVVQEKLDSLNERAESSACVGLSGTKEEANDSLDSMQAWKQSVKKCEVSYVVIIQF